MAFTGPLKSFSRMDAMHIILDNGGTVSSSVSRKTNIVVTNARDIETMSPTQMSTKLRKAMDLKNKGFNIEIMSEQVFLTHFESY